MAKKRDRKSAGPAPASAAGSPLAEKLMTTHFTWTVVGICVLLTLMLFGSFVFSDKMLFGTDTMANEYMKRTIYAEHMKDEGGIPRWNGYMLGGLPFIDAMHGDIFYPTTLLMKIMPVHRALGWKLILHVMLAGIFMFLCLKRMGLHRYAALAGGLMYMYAPNFVSFIYGGHDGKIFVMALFPLMFLALYTALQTKRLYHFILFGGTVGLSLLTSHIQMTYFALWGLGLYFAYRLVSAYIDNRDTAGAFKLAGFFAVGCALGLGIGLVQLYPPMVYVREFSVRAAKTGYAHAASWAMHPEEAMSLLVPEFGNFLGNYWGRNPFRLNYPGMGIIVVLFAVIRLLVRRTREEWAFMILALLALFFAMGEHTPVHRIAYYIIPGVKLFRGPEMSMFQFVFFAVLLAGMGVNSVMQDTPADRKRFMKILFGITGGFALIAVIALMTGGTGVLKAWQGIFYTDIDPKKAQALVKNGPVFLGGIWVVTLLVGVCTALVYAMQEKKIKPAAFAVLIGALAVFEMWRINYHFVEPVNHHRYFAKDQAIARLQQEKGYFRVYPLPGSYQYASLVSVFGLQTIDGFHDNEIASYQKFRDGNRNFIYKIQKNEVATNPFLNLMNVRFILYRHPKTQQIQIIRNEGAMPRAWVASGYEVVDTSRIVSRIKDPSFDYRNTIILEKDPGVTVAPAGSTAAGTVTINKLEDARIELTADMQRPGFVVLSENYFPYWHAQVDGKAAELLKADLTLRAVYVPAGKHTVTMDFVSPPVKTGMAVTWVSVLIFAGVVGGAFLRSRKKDGPQAQEGGSGINS